ncbi:L-arabinose isomerase, partial [Salmonella enterica subsp. enterica serovar Typhimurium]|nr:L-arabinose isomerase [Salmonella enterica subsp. enterica serovar Typhimurium]
LAANADDACIGVIVWMHTFSPAKMWIAGIDALAEPLLQLHTQYSERLPWSTIDMDYMNLNQSAHGDRELGYILTRLGQRRKVVVGHATHPATR